MRIILTRFTFFEIKRSEIKPDKGSKKQSKVRQIKITSPIKPSEIW